MQKYLSVWSDQLLSQPHFFGKLARRIRRFYLSAFKPEYIKKSIETTRQGECHQCGACCELIYRCPFLGKDANNLSYCRIYGDLRPSNCHIYPFDKKDSEVAQCGFSFPQ